eukprot:1193028-Prorocentrum_minimum.AAC.2
MHNQGQNPPLGAVVDGGSQQLRYGTTTLPLFCKGDPPSLATRSSQPHGQYLLLPSVYASPDGFSPSSIAVVRYVCGSFTTGFPILLTAVVCFQRSTCVV